MFHHPDNSGISAITMYEFLNEENYLFSVRGANEMVTPTLTAVRC
ncbi:hypothetical protein ECSTECO31_4050 [Escherichia coli STEC_O31]|jgi:hypothetical protein|nr:hypothetical protein ECSTECDG1313_3129 [Escherichia coli STEC_DG131-3]EJK94157.1 hypothetical protein ECSTECO31_4050 [Escherichia coli STEC_O31]